MSEGAQLPQVLIELEDHKIVVRKQGPSGEMLCGALSQEAVRAISDMPDDG